MIIHRSQPESGWARLPNAALRDPRLSYAARGVLAEVLSRPDDWAESADSIARRARRERGRKGEGRDTLRRIFAELESAGYLHRHLSRGRSGRFGTELHVFDVAQEVQADGHPLYCTLARFGISAGRTDDGTGSRRSDQGKHASSQVAPTTGSPGVGQPVVGAPVVGQPGVSTKTEDEDLSTKTDDEDHRGPEDIRALQSPVPVEGNGAASDQDHQQQEMARLMAWLREHPEAVR